MRSEQVTLHAQKVAPTGGEVQSGLHPDLPLDKIAHRPCRHAHARHWRIGHVDHVCACIVQQGRARQQFVSRESARRIHLHADRKFPSRKFLCQLGWLFHILRFCFQNLRGFPHFRNLNRCCCKCFFHRGDVLRGGAAATAHNVRACFTESQRVIAKVIGISGVHNSAAHLFGPACVWLHPKLRGAVGYSLPHLFENPQQLRRPARTIHPDHIRARPVQCARYLHRVIAKQGAVIAGERHRSHHRQSTCLFRGFDRFLNFIKIAHRFDHDQVNARLCQRADLLHERFARLLRLDPAIWSDPHPKRTNIPCDQHFLERSSDDSLCQFHACVVDLFYLVCQSVLFQFVAVRSKGVGDDQFCTCFDILAVNIRHGGRVGEIQFIETFSKIHAMRVQHCPHRAIGDDRFL